MRRVNLGPIEGALLPEDPSITAAKTRHLTYRMEEFLPDGLLVKASVDARSGLGKVGICLPNLPCALAARHLGQVCGVVVCPEEDGMIWFLVSSRASFEDIDYVQAAVTTLFSL